MRQALRLAVASGKGGTGKTTVATSLAMALARAGAGAGAPVTFVDADVEAPNGHLFLRPRLERELPVELLVPRIDPERCTRCGQCVAFCQFSALVDLGADILFFAELCHACGGCRRVCPEAAICEHGRRIGTVEEGQAGPVRFISGRLDIGQPLAPPVIRAAQQRLPAGGVVVVDAPPGTACAAVQATAGADFVLLVAEPTPFGLHDLELAAQMVRKLGAPGAVVANRADDGMPALRAWCAAQGLEVIMEIPDDRRIAAACARGQLLVDVFPEYAGRFLEMFGQIERRLAA